MRGAAGIRSEARAPLLEDFVGASLADGLPQLPEKETGVGKRRPYDSRLGGTALPLKRARFYFVSTSTPSILMP